MSKPLSINLSVRASDGSFETVLSFPVDASQDQREWIVQTWLKAMDVAISGSKSDDGKDQGGKQ